MLSCKNCSIKKDWIDTHLNEYDSVLDACYDFIEFTKSMVYAKMQNSVECKYQLLCDGATFDVTSDREHITVGIDIENLIAVEFWYFPGVDSPGEYDNYSLNL